MDDKCVLFATLICTYVCVVCICIHVLLCVVCVCIVCQCSCVDMCIGLRLMSSVILNYFSHAFWVGVSPSNPGLTDSSHLAGQPLKVINYLLFVWNYMYDACIPSTYVVSGKSKLQSSSLPGRCLNCLAVSVALPFNCHVSSGEKTPHIPSQPMVSTSESASKGG